MALRENPSSSRQTGLINDPAPAYIYENVQIWVPLPVIPVPGHPVLTTPMDEPTLVPSPVPTSMATPAPLIQEKYNLSLFQKDQYIVCFFIFPFIFNKVVM